ncbi:MAG: carbohydrate kinase family protein [Gammaproteobacteria bacterium]|nr:carbohydrate kinase family protein [Gammaproteobacteria bacterium]
MSALICGSFAYDTIMVFQDQFKNHILPESVHMLNVSFLVPEMRRETGGCAGNIAYNLKLLGGEPLPMATVGEDFTPYRDWMRQCAIDDRYVVEIPNSYTAQAFITTDIDDNQITAFHPGAMSFSQQNQVTDATGVKLGIVAPDGRDGMLQHAAQFAAAKIPFIFDPGQGLPMFNGEELLHFIHLASWVAVNDYEAQLLQERTGYDLPTLAQQVEALIVTRGGSGSSIYLQQERIDIPVVAATAINDPTGCGDAYRAGLLYGIERGLEWQTTGRIAALLGAIKIASHGTQNHSFTLESFSSLYQFHYGVPFPA